MMEFQVISSRMRTSCASSTTREWPTTWSRVTFPRQDWRSYPARVRSTTLRSGEELYWSREESQNYLLIELEYLRYSTFSARWRDYQDIIFSIGKTNQLEIDLYTLKKCPPFSNHFLYGQCFLLIHHNLDEKMSYILLFPSRIVDKTQTL